MVFQEALFSGTHQAPLYSGTAVSPSQQAGSLLETCFPHGSKPFPSQSPGLGKCDVLQTRPGSAQADPGQSPALGSYRGSFLVPTFSNVALDVPPDLPQLRRADTLSAFLDLLAGLDLCGHSCSPLLTMADA